MSISLWILASVIGLLGLWIVFLNWFRHVLMARHFRKTGERRFISSAPIIGPVLLSVAWLIGTIDGHTSRWGWVWVPWVLDEGTWVMLYGLLYWFVLRPMGVRNAPGYKEVSHPPPSDNA